MSNDRIKEKVEETPGAPHRLEPSTQPALAQPGQPVTAAQNPTACTEDKTGGKEDKKAAVQLWTTVSTQLITATLAMIAVQGAFITFFFDKRHPSTSFFVFSCLALVLFILSIAMAAKGIGALAQSGYSGEWKKDDAVVKFFLQTVLCLLGLVFFFTSLLFSGPTKETESDKQVKELQQQVEILKRNEVSTKESLDQLRQDYSSLQEKLKRQVEDPKMRPALPGRKSK